MGVKTRCNGEYCLAKDLSRIIWYINQIDLRDLRRRIHIIGVGQYLLPILLQRSLRRMGCETDRNRGHNLAESLLLGNNERCQFTTSDLRWRIRSRSKRK